MRSSQRIPVTADSGMIQQARMSLDYDETLVNNSGTTRSFIGAGRSAVALMTLRKNISLGISNKIRLRISGVDRLIVDCAGNFAEIGKNFPSVANAAMPIRAGIVVEKSLRKRFFSAPQPMAKEASDRTRKEAFF